MQTFRALLRLHVQGGSPTRWSYQADFMLLVRLWRNQLQGATTTPRVPGRSRLEAQERLATLAAALPASALNVQPANEAECTSLLHLLQRLASSSGRKELIAEVAAEQQELDARMESSVFAQELEQHHASSEVQSLLFALDKIHVRWAERCTNWTIDEHLELIAKVHRCQAPLGP